MSIRWPERFDPRNAPVFVSNEIVTSAPASAVWAWLVNAPFWPSYYSNSSDVVLENGARRLGPGMTFRWKTFGVSLVTRVEEFEPEGRIAWRARGLGVDAYHAWLITPLPDGGCRVLTEETQYGFASRLGQLFMPGRMYRYHRLWLEGLRERAESGLPSL
jgi:hypothetical protein